MFGKRVFQRFALAAGLLSGMPALAAPDDSKPELVSTSGGWATTAELKKAAEAHDPRACALYGDALLRGEDVQQDAAQAMVFLREAVSLGEPNAAFRLGKIYDDGEHSPQDYAKAIDYYRLAAKAGVVEAQYNLGVLHVTGRGTKRDYVEGLAWLIVATKGGTSGDGEQKTREQIAKIKRPQYITAAERRAAEILKNPAASDQETSPITPGAPGKTATPVKIEVVAPMAPQRIELAPAATPPPLGPGLVAPIIPKRPEPPPAPGPVSPGTEKK